MDPIRTDNKSHINILDFLRGIAALSVVLFHYSGSVLPTIKPNYLTDYFSYGKLGVQVFFVISGFIIPYSMYVSGYQIQNFPKFIFKRLTRIGPPSWIAILLVFGIYFGALWMKGKPIDGMIWPGVSPGIILANMFYSYTLFDFKPYIDVYWTLEIEFQFYLVIGILLPLLIKFRNNLFVLSLLLIGLNCTYFFNQEKLLFFRDNAFFILGMLLFMYKQKVIPRTYFIYASIVTMLMCYGQQELPRTFAAIIGFMIIAFVSFSNSFTSFLGNISYSLYITHCLAGVLIEFVLRNFTGLQPDMITKTFMLFVYTGLSLGFAWVFYKLVEQPFISISQKIRFRKGR